MKIAVIDIGTNTFNLLIVEYRNNNYELILKAKESVKLGRGGINNSIILPEAMERGMVALRKYKSIIDTYCPKEILAFATSALRSADNNAVFISKVKKELFIDIKVITGCQEAEYIYYGIRNVVPLTEEKVLMLDIGGGSNEFIIANKDKIFWKQSFNLGMARVLELFNPSDPITKGEIAKIQQYFYENLSPLFDALKIHNISTLVGSSGSFDTFKKMIFLYYEKNFFPKQLYYTITISDFKRLHKTLIESTTAEREKMEGLDIMRVEMIHIASILVDLLIEKLKIKTFIRSNFSLKEGILLDYIKKISLSNT